MKPKELSIFTCPICGATYTERAHANRCIKVHLDATDLKIHHTVLHIPTTKYSHHLEDPYPAAIQIYSDKTDGLVTYIRADSISSLRPKARNPRAPMWGK